MLEENGRLANFETAVKYQFYHVFALIAVALLLDKFSSKTLVYSGYSFILGIIFFSGSLYLLSSTNVTKWGAVTRIGGLFFLIAWAVIIVGIMRK